MDLFKIKNCRIKRYSPLSAGMNVPSKHQSAMIQCESCPPQWTEAKYRCPECEDTLIIYDPWFAPPPTLHIPMWVANVKIVG